jgi:hypothetical protein
MNKEDEINRLRVSRELAWVAQSAKPLALISTTAREGIRFAVTPRRSALGFDCICMMFGAEEPARMVLPLLDGKVSSILVDVESKKPISLMSLAKELAPGTHLIPCKPNDATLESLDLLIQDRIGFDLSGKRVMVYAIGNLGAKIALRMAERGAEVFATSRNAAKCNKICEALNLFLPKYSPHRIRPLKNMEDVGPASLDALISCTSSNGTLGREAAPLLKEHALVVDVGIDNFKPEFYTAAKLHNLQCFRLDIRIGLLYLLMPLYDNVHDFFEHACGSVVLDGNVRIVSGGFVGEKGSVIVDNIHAPTQIIGVANGIGGIIPEAELDPMQKELITTVRFHVESNVKEVC